MPFESIIFQVGALLLFAIVLGEITQRLGFSALVGQILAGIIAGPVLGWVHPDHLLEFLSFLGLIVLVFLIGLETKKEEIKKDVYTGVALAGSGAFLTLISGLLAAYVLFNDFNVGLALGVAMISTSTAIPIKILIEKKEYHTHTGRIFVIMAIADDVIAILMLSLLVSYLTLSSISVTYIVSLFLAILGFIFFILTAGDRIINSAIQWVNKSKDPEILFTIPLSIAFLISLWSESIGLAAVTGAFIAGMAMSRSYFNESIIQPKIKSFGYAFAVPLFFAYSSIFVDINTFFNEWHLILIFLFIGIAAKAVGSGLMARFFGFNAKSQLIIAIGMIPRGEYGIVISQIALSAGVINNQLYTVMISFIVLTVIITPILFELISRTRFWK